MESRDITMAHLRSPPDIRSPTFARFGNPYVNVDNDGVWIKSNQDLAMEVWSTLCHKYLSHSLTCNELFIIEKCTN